MPMTSKGFDTIVVDEWSSISDWSKLWEAAAEGKGVGVDFSGVRARGSKIEPTSWPSKRKIPSSLADDINAYLPKTSVPAVARPKSLADMGVEMPKTKGVDLGALMDEARKKISAALGNPCGEIAATIPTENIITDGTISARNWTDTYQAVPMPESSISADDAMRILDLEQKVRTLEYDLDQRQAWLNTERRRGTALAEEVKQAKAEKAAADARIKELEELLMMQDHEAFGDW